MAHLHRPSRYQGSLFHARSDSCLSAQHRYTTILQFCYNSWHRGHDGWSACEVQCLCWLVVATAADSRPNWRLTWLAFTDLWAFSWFWRWPRMKRFISRSAACLDSSHRPIKGASRNVQTGGQLKVSFADAATSPDAWANLAQFSSKGPTTDGRVKPDLLAPGTLLSAYTDPSTGNSCSLRSASMPQNIFSGSISAQSTSTAGGYCFNTMNGRLIITSNM